MLLFQKKLNLGAGSFSSLGSAVFKGGPGVVLLFIITAVACAFTAFCYSEFASRIPVAGSAYTYAYASFGELFAWIIGWALIMEYSIGNIYVAYSWSGYFVSLLDKLHIQLPIYLTTSYMEAKHALEADPTDAKFSAIWNAAPIFKGLRIILDLPALIINLLITYLVYIGVKESRNFSNLMVILKLGVVFLIIGVGGYYIFANGLTSNWMPTNDKNITSFMPNGFSGVMASVASVFFAYIGFDAVSVMAEESKNPQRDLPKSMIYSLVICTVIYILLTFVLSGAVNYKNFNHVDDPLAFIFQKQNLNIGWMQFLVSVVAVVAMTSVLLVFQMGQPRIWMSMSRDGLLPNKFQKIHPKYKTPSFATIITGLVVGVPILFTDKTFVLDFTSIATLFAFVLVCGGVLLLPRKEKVAGKFNLPYVNGKIIFPLIVVGTMVAFGLSSKNYFGNKINFTKENQVDELTKLIPTEKVDSILVNNTAQQYIQDKNKTNDAFKGLADSLQVRTSAADQLGYTIAYIKGNNPTQSKTEKISLVIFFLTLIGLAIATFIKKYSLIPLLGVSSCLYLLTSMTLNNWLWFGAWLALGLVVYFLYGYRKSKLAGG